MTGREQISEEPDQFPIITAVSLSFHRPENRNPFYSSQRHPLRKNRELPSQEAWSCGLPVYVGGRRLKGCDTTVTCVTVLTIITIWQGFFGSLDSTWPGNTLYVNISALGAYIAVIRGHSSLLLVFLFKFVRSILMIQHCHVVQSRRRPSSLTIPIRTLESSLLSQRLGLCDSESLSRICELTRRIWWSWHNRRLV
jgi:hypothetical protein